MPLLTRSTSSTRGARRGHHPRRLTVACAGLLLGALARPAAACHVFDHLPAATFAAAETLRIPAGEGAVWFEANTLLNRFRGTTRQVAGRIQVSAGEGPRQAVGCVHIEAASLDTGNSWRDASMRETYLEVGRLPTIVFALTAGRIRPSGPGGQAEAVLAGDLTVHGVTRAVTIPARVVLVGREAQVTGQVGLRMSDFGIWPPAFIVIPVRDEVVVSFKILATPNR